VKIAKAVIDTVGHYARPDLFTLAFHGRAAEGAGRARARRAVESLPRGELARIADRHEVDPAQIEEAVSGLA
jgi:hypothetical protein